MTRVKCDDCGDEHSCEPATVVATAAKPKGKQKLSPAMLAKNEQAKADKAKREAAATTVAVATTTTTTAKRSVLRELIGF